MHKYQLQKLINDAVDHAVAEGTLPHCTPNSIIERPKKVTQGHFSTTVALQLAKACRMSPRAIAAIVIEKIDRSHFAHIEIAGAGFINFFLAQHTLCAIVDTVRTEGAAYGNGDPSQTRIVLEFVSANPTGPLHVGHGRGAAYGSTLANTLIKAGHNVTTEYYVNDAGRQTDILALSVWLRYLAQTDTPCPDFPKKGYRGDYIADIAQTLYAQYKETLIRPFAYDGRPVEDDIYLDALIAGAQHVLGEQWANVRTHATDAVLAVIRRDLTDFGISFDSWFSEQSLFTNGHIDTAIDTMQKNDAVYEKDGALWFRATTYGDEKDRVLKRSNGSYTYFASDIAYHTHKHTRGFDRMIDMFGADHHGYIARLQGALTTCGIDAECLSVVLVQFAHLVKNGETVQMSTRSGEFVSLRELIDMTGKDAARFFYIARRADQHLTFDIDLARAQSNDNPVYYVQYAIARIYSLLEKANNTGLTPNTETITSLTLPEETGLLLALARFPEVVRTAADTYEPHSIAQYALDMAGLFHRYYAHTPCIVQNTPAISTARLALVDAVRIVLIEALRIIGVSAPQSMHNTHDT